MKHAPIKHILLLLFLAFYAISLFAQSKIQKMEYFIDADPGRGNGTNIPITANTTLDIPLNVPTASLSEGFHVLTIRARDDKGAWSLSENRVFYVGKSSSLVSNNIDKMEYFIDADPGRGSGTNIPITANTNLEIPLNVPTASLTEGFHVLTIRARDNKGAWSLTEQRPFYVNRNRKIIAYEYAIDTDPGVGKATNRDTNSQNIEFNHSTDQLTNGNHKIFIRVKDEYNFWSNTSEANFNICNGATPKFTAETVCLGAVTTFTDQSTSATGDKYSWDFDGDGNADENRSGNQTYTYKKAGTFKAKLTIDRAGCDASYTVDVIVTPQPTPNAGTDQTICGNKVTLNAVPPKTNEIGRWGIFKGTGIIENENNHNATFTSTSPEATLRWTVTNTLGGCSKSDDVVITNNQTIEANPTNSKVEIGQTITSSILSKAKGNITTTIIDPQPKKGTAKVLASGEISYTPNPKTLGKDTVRYQLKNQCKKTATSYWVIDIINSAPTIKQPTVKVTKDRKRSIDLPSLISDPNDNIDLSTLQIVKQPKSGAKASISPSRQLLIDYTGVIFRGRDELTVKVCDTKGACAEQVIFIEVDFEPLAIIVYNAVSPNGDNKHDFLEIENIDSYKGNKVVIFSRWGDVVFKTENYNNTSNYFKGKSDSGKDLPSGTYYYTIDLNNGKDPIKGFVLLNK